MKAEDPVVIVAAKRTPMGSFQGSLKGATAPLLGAAALKATLDEAGLDGGQVDEVFMGCVLPAGQGQAPARQAALGAGIPLEVGCTTVNKMCGSGMKTTMLAHDLIQAGSAEVMLAGGMESMSNAPYLLPKARDGYRMGHNKVMDHMFLDGLEDAYDKGRLMGTYAEDTAEHYQFTREAQDSFAIESLARARRATEQRDFVAEITPMTLKGRRGDTLVGRDEQPFKADPDKIPGLKPAFREGGTVTAANSSSISDGAAALLLMKRSEAERRGLTPRAVIHGHASYAKEPAWFTTAPVHALNGVLDKLGWQSGEVDLYEINEAFAVVTMVAMRELDLPHDKVNVNGGACALGHPIGASGARIIVTLLAAMEARDVKKGIAGLCIGGGEATAIALERLN